MPIKSCWVSLLEHAREYYAQEALFVLNNCLDQQTVGGGGGEVVSDCTSHHLYQEARQSCVKQSAIIESRVLFCADT